MLRERLFKYMRTVRATRSGKHKLRFSWLASTESLMWNMDIFHMIILIHCWVIKKSACCACVFDCSCRIACSRESVSMKNSAVRSATSVSIARPKVWNSKHKSVKARRPGCTSCVSRSGRSGSKFKIRGRSNLVVWPLGFLFSE